MAKSIHPVTFRATVYIAVVVALAVVAFGAYVRLSDAGLGCPDWPGCYGHVIGVPQAPHEVMRANQAFPDRPLVTAKAIKEMTHRYLAGALGLLILTLAIIAVRHRRRSQQPLALPMVLLLLVVFQALLGMWTVTLQLKPVIVMAHLLGGFATLSLLWWLFLSGSGWSKPDWRSGSKQLRTIVLVGTLILIVQIALGGWTSANYAALACPDFPTCQSQWWPQMDFSEGFVLWRGLGIDYEFGVLDNSARTAIHVAHRIGALITAIYLITLASILLLRSRERVVRIVGGVVLLLTMAQVSLGIFNVMLGLPLIFAVAHNATAASLLLAMLTLNYLFTVTDHAAASQPATSGAEYKKGVNDVLA